MTKLTRDFYIRPDVIQISRELLGKFLFTRINSITTAGIITETEAYAGASDRASHAYNNRRTARTEVMYAEGGTAYVYLCYGIHHLFNVVTNTKDIPHAILIRAVYPAEGISGILKRRKLNATLGNHLAKTAGKISGGPGTVSQALGIRTMHSGLRLTGNMIWIEDRCITLRDENIICSPRIGVDYAGKDAKLPYRFWIDYSKL